MTMNISADVLITIRVRETKFEAHLMFSIRVCDKCICCFKRMQTEPSSPRPIEHWISTTLTGMINALDGKQRPQNPQIKEPRDSDGGRHATKPSETPSECGTSDR